MRIFIPILIIGLLLLAGCDGFGVNVSGSDGSKSPPLTMRILDLTTGVLGPEVRQASGPGLDTTRMVFVRVPAGSFTPGQSPGTLGQQADETPGAVQDVATFWVARYEITQAQWMTLSDGDRPWLRLAPAGSTGGDAEDSLLPAAGLTHEVVDETLTAWNSGADVTLALPSEMQWEYACRANSSGLFSWGDSLDPGVVASHAILGANGPVEVGTRSANRFGLRDMHGNLREWTVEGTLRGGGWGDLPLRARSANRVEGIDPSTQHALSGARLILIP